MEIVEGQNQGGAGPQLLQLFRLALGGGLQLDIHELAAGGRGLGQDSSCEATEPRNLPPLAARRQVAMTTAWGWYCDEALDRRQRLRRLAAGSLT